MLDQQAQDELLLLLGSFSKRPLEFVLWAFPWGEPGELQKFPNGPESWQIEILKQLGQGLITADEAIQLARASGHGIGKSALVAWIIIWAVATREDTKGVVTANTETQLKTKTWAEVAKWFRLFIGKDLFKQTATAIFSRDPEHERTWRIDMVPWSEKNTEAFAGLHNQGSRILVVFDEASAIPDVIWEVTEGALTDLDTEIIWVAFGNPTKNTGRFRECFENGKFAHRWQSAAIDSRTVSFTNKEQIKKWIEDYGEDSDFVRVRVKGQFPSQDDQAFFPYELLREATARQVEDQSRHPLVIGVDVARYGSNSSVIAVRRGWEAAAIPWRALQKTSTMELATIVNNLAHRLQASAIFVDEGGVGGGVVDRLMELGAPVWGVNFGGKPTGSNWLAPQEQYANKRTEMYGTARSWLRKGRIPAAIAGIEGAFIDEAASITYTHDALGRIALTPKEQMLRTAGVPSPDSTDAFVLTFAEPVHEAGFHTAPPPPQDYDPIANERFAA